MLNSIFTFSVSINDFFGDRDHYSCFALLPAILVFQIGQTRSFQISTYGSCFCFGWRGRRFACVSAVNCTVVWMKIIFWVTSYRLSGLLAASSCLCSHAQLSEHGWQSLPSVVLLQTSCVWIKRSFFLLTTMHQADLNPCASLNPKMHLTTGPLVSRSLLKAEPWLLNHQSDFWWFPTGNNILGQCLGEWNNPEF